MTDLNDLAREIHAISIDKGFWPELEREGVVKPWGPGGRNPFEVLALIHSEVSECLEAMRDRKWESSVSWHPTANTPPWTQEEGNFELGPDGVRYCPAGSDRQVEVTDEMMRAWGYVPKPEGVPSELADIIIRVLDACAGWDIDIQTAVELKIQYNATREYKHGRAA